MIGAPRMLRHFSGAASARWLALPFALTLAVACQPGPEAAATARVKAFLFDIAAGRYESAADAVRAENGAVLTVSERASRISDWRRAFGDGTKISITRFAATTVRPSTQAELPAIATVGYQVIFDMDGTSATPCFVLPSQGSTARAAQIEGGWYLIPDALNTVRPPPNCAAP
jgi:hypothetical protein